MVDYTLHSQTFMDRLRVADYDAARRDIINTEDATVTVISVRKEHQKLK